MTHSTVCEYILTYEVHRELLEQISEVWANMLHNVYAALVAKHGYAQDAMTNPCGGAGNVIFMHLFIDSLSLLPCYPDCEYL